jgi:hypothetical protein
MHEIRVLLLPVLLVAAGLLAGCSTRDFLQSGDAKSAVVTYTGDIEAATAVARKHCAGYERVPRLVETSMDTAYFDCVSR